LRNKAHRRSLTRSRYRRRRRRSRRRCCHRLHRLTVGRGPTRCTARWAGSPLPRSPSSQ
jgi:hypothetical protein